MFDAKGSGLTRTNFRCLPAKVDLTKEKLCCVYSEMTAEIASQSSAGETLRFSIKMQSRKQQELRRKNIRVRLVYFTPFAIFTRFCTE